MKPRYKDDEEYQKVLHIRNITHKKMEICLLCLRCNGGNLQKAIEFCSVKASAEDGRLGLCTI